uniref:PfkB family carbohydrate kinase n=1 Tax=Allorhizocola rhizosphaerae TaxID=1872709 RepID=UPI001FE82082
MKPLVVIGDALLDRDLSGRVERVCPGEPAPVFDEADAADRPGGAALAAVLAALGDRPVQLVASVGRDPAGQRLRQLIEEAGVELLELSEVDMTPEKVRLRVGSRTVLRLDRNSAPAPVGAPGPSAQRALADAACVLVSDYGRGTTSANEVRRLIAACAATRPVVWDPHPRGGSPVPRLRLVVPNESELPGGTGKGSIASLTQAAFGARNRWRASAVAVTLGERGALLVDGGGVPLMVRPPVRGDGDACGAGDRFAAAATAALADGAVTSEAVSAAVEA